MCPLPTFLSYKANQSGSSLNPALAIVAMRWLLWHHVMIPTPIYQICTRLKRIHYSIPTSTTSNNSTLLPTIAFCSRARLLQGSSFKALSKSASQVNSSQEWNCSRFFSTIVASCKCSHKKSSCHPKMHGICLNTLTWHGNEWHELCIWNTLECIIPVAALARIPKWYPVSSGFHCYICYSLWTFMRCLGKLIE